MNVPSAAECVTMLLTHDPKHNILMEKSTEEALILSQMGLDTMAHSNMGRDTEEARLRNRVVRSMKECGKKMKNMVKADSLSLMGQDMWENS